MDHQRKAGRTILLLVVKETFWGIVYLQYVDIDEGKVELWILSMHHHHEREVALTSFGESERELKRVRIRESLSA